MREFELLEVTERYADRILEVIGLNEVESVLTLPIAGVL